VEAALGEHLHGRIEHLPLSYLTRQPLAGR